MSMSSDIHTVETSGLLSTGFQAMSVLVDLCRTVDATGGIERDHKNYPRPVADPDWVDLGEVYLSACALIGRAPKVADDPDDETDYNDLSDDED
jgi:hypothetical protein